MNTKRKPLIVGNWKMNGTIEETLKRLTELCHKLPESEISVCVAPPFTALYTAHVVLQETAIELAAQNMHWEAQGAFTGEVSGVFLKDIGCKYVILGHSERRQFFGDTDDAVHKKVVSAIASELTPIFCLGETLDQRKSEKVEETLENQLKKGLQGISLNDLKNIVIAYEPIWAIGTGNTATSADIGNALGFIRAYIAKNFDAPTSQSIRILYGGSVTPENAGEISNVKDVDGLLVGGASLEPQKFLKIIEAYGKEKVVAK